MNEAIDIATLVGFVGMVCIIAAYAYLTWKQEPNPFILHGTNLIGAALLGGLHFVMLAKGFQIEPLLYLGATVVLVALRLPALQRRVALRS